MCEPPCCWNNHTICKQMPTGSCEKALRGHSKRRLGNSWEFLLKDRRWQYSDPSFMTPISSNQVTYAFSNVISTYLPTLSFYRNHTWLCARSIYRKQSRRYIFWTRVIYHWLSFIFNWLESWGFGWILLYLTWVFRYDLILQFSSESLHITWVFIFNLRL